ncbi:MAG TPA: molecular chaperone TorD family protein [Rhodanobacteraceae bacterium]
MTSTIETWDRLADALEYPAGGPPEVQEQYVDAFDLDPTCSLDVGWHLFGEAPERGRFLAMLRDELARAGVPEGDDLPDHLPTVLRLIGRADADSASELAAIVAPAVSGVLERLEARGSPFASAIKQVAALLDGRLRHEEQP